MEKGNCFEKLFHLCTLRMTYSTMLLVILHQIIYYDSRFQWKTACKSIYSETFQFLWAASSFIILPLMTFECCSPKIVIICDLVTFMGSGRCLGTPLLQNTNIISCYALLWTSAVSLYQLNNCILCAVHIQVLSSKNCCLKQLDSFRTPRNLEPSIKFENLFISRVNYKLVSGTHLKSYIGIKVK